MDKYVLKNSYRMLSSILLKILLRSMTFWLSVGGKAPVEIKGLEAMVSDSSLKRET